MANTKGIALVNVRRFVLERGGDQRWAELRGGFDAQGRELLDSIVAVGWYDLAFYVTLLRRVDSLLGHGDLAMLRPLGRFQAESDLRTIHRVFLRLANPGFTVSKVAELWRRYHDTGRWRVERPSATHVVATLDDHGVVDVALCSAMSAYMARLLELVGARALRFSHSECRARGAVSCVYEAHWAS